MEQWYALYTTPGAERQVALRLEENGIQTYVPVIREVEKQKRERIVPFFPCYLFMYVDVDTTVSSLWQWTPGLRYIVAFGGVPLAVPSQTIELIRQKLEQLNDVLSKPRPQFKPGDVVRIANGPLADMLALFEGPSKPSERVVVLLNFLGQANRVRLNAADLEIAPSKMDIAPSNMGIAPHKRPRRTRGRGRPIHPYERTYESQ
jgi:transcriptional antiterminator RfaH